LGERVVESDHRSVSEGFAAPEACKNELTVEKMAAYGVRREKAALFSGCEAHPAIGSRRKRSEQ
jgi:hypothetical protein